MLASCSNQRPHPRFVSAIVRALSRPPSRHASEHPGYRPPLPDTMDSAPHALEAVAQPLPALSRDATGRPHVDYRAVAVLAAPLFLNSSIQAVLSPWCLAAAAYTQDAL